MRDEGGVGTISALRDEPKDPRARFFRWDGLVTRALCANSGIDGPGEMWRHDLDEPPLIGRESFGRGGVEREHGDERVADRERQADTA